MTKDELKKLVNYQYQLVTFALSMADDQQANPAWSSFAQKLLSVGGEMLEDIQKELGA